MRWIHAAENRERPLARRGAGDLGTIGTTEPACDDDPFRARVSNVGAYFLVVNPTKRQYLDPGRFGEPVKFSNVLAGDYCLRALKLLIADCFPRDEGAFRGAWLGDPVILASDDTGLPDPGPFVTAAAVDPRRNLHALASDEFTDISYRALAELCRDAEIAEELAERAKREDRFLVDLGTVLLQYRPFTLEQALERTVGRPWRKAYQQAMTVSRRQPLMPIDWPLTP